MVIAASSIVYAASYLRYLNIIHAFCCGVVMTWVLRLLRSVLSLLKPHSGADCRPPAGTWWAAAESWVEKRPPAFQAQPGLGILSTFLLRKMLPCMVLMLLGWGPSVRLATTLWIGSVRTQSFPVQSFLSSHSDKGFPQGKWEPRSCLPGKSENLAGLQPSRTGFKHLMFYLHALLSC